MCGGMYENISMVVGDEDVQVGGDEGRAMHAAGDAWLTNQWRDAWAAQDTCELRRAVRRCAEHRAWVVSRSGGRSDAALADEIIADVVADTWLGRLRWDPARASLQQHLVANIHSRTKATREQLARNPHISADANEDSETVSGEVEDALAAYRGSSGAHEKLFAAELAAKLRQLGDGDHEVLRLLDAYCAGAAGRGDVLTAASMPARTYDAARKRLDGLLEDLPQSASRRASARRRTNGA